MINEGNLWHIANQMKDAADRAMQAADRMEAASHRIALMLEDGYGGNGLRLAEALEKLALEKLEKRA
jgi:hypothetical protein